RGHPHVLSQRGERDLTSAPGRALVGGSRSCVVGLGRALRRGSGVVRATRGRRSRIAGRPPNLLSRNLTFKVSAGNRDRGTCECEKDWPPSRKMTKARPIRA